MKTVPHSNNEPGEEWFQHIYDGDVKNDTRVTLCGRMVNNKDMEDSLIGTAVYTPSHEDVCSKCREVFEQEFVVVRQRRGFSSWKNRKP